MKVSMPTGPTVSPLPFPPPAPPKRADARRNYELLLAAAEVEFATRGVDVPLDDIAVRAGVGNATLYRHFPTRRALIEAVHRERIEAIGVRADDALAGEAPADVALATWLSELVAEGSTAHGLTAALTAALYEDDADVSWCRRLVEDAATRLLVRAQRAGTVRSDVRTTDVLRLVNALAVVTERCPADDRQADILLTVVMDGLRPARVGRAGVGALGGAAAEEPPPGP
ncbi:helix-turn-helix domain-containing protein [Streptomyces sp. SID3343]|uniref:TetR/AcrR family transcriptional regulator n=1 Tax=Streptomyces sp. SID3343 TaxID=2690260 RepID=UPI0031F83380